MLNTTKSVSFHVIRTAQQIDSKLMHSSERFCPNLLAKFYFISDNKFSDTRTETKKKFGLGFSSSAKHGKSQTLLCLPPLQAILRCVSFSKNATLSDLDERQTTGEAPARKYSVYRKPITFCRKQFFIRIYQPNHNVLWRNIPTT